MKNLIFIVIISSLLISCSKKNQSVNEYCSCLNSALNDSLIAEVDVANIQKKCWDSIIVAKYQLNNDKQFISDFDSLGEIKSLNQDMISQISKNINETLKRYAWLCSDRYLDRLEFDGKMFTHKTFYVITNPVIETGTYKTEVEKNGVSYITLTNSENENTIFKLMKNDEGDYYLDGKRTYWPIK